MKETKSLRTRFYNHLGKMAVALVSVAFLTGSAQAVDNTTQVLGQEGGKEALNQALKVARTKPALSTAAIITCLACAPAAGAAASPALCVACGILIAKVIG